MACCDESGCRRKQPILIRRSHFTADWFAITRYKLRDGGLVEAQEKHVLSGPTQAEIELCGTVLKDLHAHVRGRYETEDNEDAERAYRDVLDELSRLAKAKETALIGPRPEPAPVVSRPDGGDRDD